MITKNPSKGNKTNKQDVPVIQLVPPVLFIRRRKRDFANKAIKKLWSLFYRKSKIKKANNKGVYAQSKTVYTN